MIYLKLIHYLLEVMWLMPTRTLPLLPVIIRIVIMDSVIFFSCSWVLSLLSYNVTEYFLVPDRKSKKFHNLFPVLFYHVYLAYTILFTFLLNHIMLWTFSLEAFLPCFPDSSVWLHSELLHQYFGAGYNLI